jgi:hypothetical protein
MAHSISENEVIFLQALREILPFLKQQDDARLVKRIGIDKLQDAADDLAGYISVGVAGNLNKNERLALSCQLLKCVERNIQSMRVPVTLRTMIDSMETLSHSVEQSFPGYQQSRLLKYAITPVRTEHASS